ncbi:MAG: hypothetical protein A2Z81_02580 [Omnitrophica WOR_2 bacterium GWA2_45_18]|nr:MAG: hypothetical protein A2Z81_02580 [Omnitrophica WOR_2 bacterium GWA2_45_18]
MNKIQNIVKVVSNERLCPKFFRLRLEEGDIGKKAQPGQFIHIRVNDGLEPFFRRPFSIYRAQKYLEIFYEPVGLGTKRLAAKGKGDLLDVVGPLGHPFCLPPVGVTRVVMIAGGIGIAPFLMFSDVLKKKKYDLMLLYGGRTKGHVFPMREFRANGCKILIATDDGSVGVKGRVDRLFSKITSDPQSTFIYTCGPKPMMAAVQKFAQQYHFRGEAACESLMACGLGACLGCSIKTRSGFKTVCYDGPVFDLHEVIFE